MNLSMIKRPSLRKGHPILYSIFPQNLLHVTLCLIRPLQVLRGGAIVVTTVLVSTLRYILFYVFV